MTASRTKGKTLDQNRRRIDIITDPVFVDELGAVGIDELRERRQLCDGLESELSYYRRLLHGRMDLLAFELRRRRGEETRSLIEALPDILADAESSQSRSDLLPQKALPIEAPDLPSEGRRTIDRVLSDDFLAHLPSLDTAELEEIQGILTAAEREISGQRHRVYAACEQIQEELTRRYRDGLASVDELLQS